MPPRRTSQKPVSRKLPPTSVLLENQPQPNKLELKYLEIKHAITLLNADEERRQIRVSSLLLQDDLISANERKREEQEHRVEAEFKAGNWQSRAEVFENNAAHLEAELGARLREIDVMQAELSSHQSASADSQRLLTEKLTLACDIANLKSELMHLRAQTSSNQTLLSEKLTLQRQLQTAEAELADSQHAIKLATEARMEHEQETNGRVDVIERKRKDLEKELDRALTRLDEREAQDKAIEDVAKQLQETEQQLKEEQWERSKAEKHLDKVQADGESEKAVHEDKLNQFRTKLRKTKDRLKETETDLARARQEVDAGNPENHKPLKNPRKRSRVSRQDPDFAVGTPGDGPANKRSKRASSVVVGEKSTFSITPFLNRTASLSVAPEEQRQPDQPIVSIEGALALQENQESPMTRPRLSTKISGEERNALAPSSPRKLNLKNQRAVSTAAKQSRRKGPKAAAMATSLEKVAEEQHEDAAGSKATQATASEANEYTAAGAGAPAITKSIVLKPKPKLKPPKKSLSSFASFRDASLVPQRQSSLELPMGQNQNKKKRKLLSGTARTVFDEENDDMDGEGCVAQQSRLYSIAPRAGVEASKQRAFGSFASGLGGFGGGLLNRKKGPLVVAGADGFEFSPLKKERKAMRAGSELPTVADGDV